MSVRVDKAMVLAAGIGKRLRPLTVRTAKPALPLMGRPLIEYILRRLARNGVREAVVNLHHHPDTITPSLERAPDGLSIQRSFESELLGTAGGLKRVECHFSSEEAFLLLNADTLVDFDLEEMVRVHVDSRALATLLLRPKPSGSPYSAVNVTSDGRVESIITGGNGAGDGDWMFAGVWILSPQIFSRLSGAPGGLEKELLPALIAEGSAYACPQRADWITIDTPERYWAACLAMPRDGLFEGDWDVESVPGFESAWAGSGARVDAGAALVGDVVIGAGSSVAKGAHVERSVLWNDVEVPRGARLDRCVVTSGVTLRPGAELEEKLVMRVDANEGELRRREIHEDLLIASLKIEGSARVSGL